MARRNRELDYYLDWRIGPVALKVVAALGALWLTGIHWNYAGFPAWAPAAIGVIVAGVILRSSAMVDLPHLPYSLAQEERRRLARIGFFRAACWALTGVWASYTMYAGYSVAGSLALAVGTGVAIEIGNKVNPQKSKDDNGQGANTTPASDDPAGLGTELAPDVVAGGPMFAQQLATALTIKGVAGRGVPVTVKRTKLWPNETGHTWAVSAPFGTDFGFEQLRNVVGGLGPMLQWPTGCPITAKTGGDHQAQALLDMCVFNGLTQNFQFSTDYSPRSIVNPFPIGRYLDQTRAMLSLYRDIGLMSGLVGGKQGSGKTVLLHDITGNLVLCRDAIVIHVDLNGGSMGAPWTRPFAKGLVERPGVDFVASGPDDALWVAEWAADIVSRRKARINELMYGHNSDVLLPGNGFHACKCGKVHPPAIIIMVDEAAEIAGDAARNTALAATEALREVQRKGRAMGVQVIWAALRGVASVIPTEVKALTAFVFAGLVRGDDELAYLLDWGNGVTIKDLITAGLFYYRPDVGAPIQLIKTDGLLPTQIGEIVVAAEENRPMLPEEERIHGWDQRWSRPEATEYLLKLRGGEVIAGESDIEEGGGTITITDRRRVRPPVAEQPPWHDVTAEPADEQQQDEPFDASKTIDLGGMTVDDMEAWFSMDDAEEPRESQINTAEVGPEIKDRGARFTFIARLLADAGEQGLKTQDVIAAVLAEFPTSTAKRWLDGTTTKEDLREMRAQHLIAKHKSAYATWVLHKYNPDDDGK